jgi:arylsulfatase A
MKLTKSIASCLIGLSAAGAEQRLHVVRVFFNGRRGQGAMKIMKYVGFLMVGMLLFTPGIVDVQAETPNIIVILGDDLGYGDLGCFGQKVIKTPELDRMAAEGMKLTRFYSGSTVCAPSRASMLTGLHTGHVWVRGNGNGVKLRDNPKDITVATLLQNAGYATGMIGKSGLGCNLDTDTTHPNRKGFDYFYGSISHWESHDYYPPYVYRNGDKIEFPNNKRHEGTDYIQDHYIQEALDFIDREKDGPFMLHYAPQFPHASLCIPDEWKKPYRGQFDEIPFKGNHYRSEPEPKTTYAAMVSRLDWEVGQILSKLRKLGLAEDTLVLFASDNGSMQEGGYEREWFNSSGPLRGGKRDLFEGGIRVPAIAWWPSTIAAGSESDHVAAFWDILPTACELATIPAPSNTDGISFVPTLKGKAKQKKHEYLYWEFHEQGGKQAVLMNNWKAIRRDVRNHPNGPLELYDLSKDPQESKNIAAAHPEKTHRFAEIMQTARSDSPRFHFQN